ncbi:basic chitinase [Actinidia rufa]|uniref:Basic chitinase n=1 Tax=Actinidia rufa TaxID=165716 RepID=A0A7J0GF72_9ERIC|nr:basic chitinase [Actinidia rufa]
MRGDLSSVISRAQFEQLLKHRNDAACQGKGFYTYDAFVSAAKSFGAFGNTGDAVTKKREVAAFFLLKLHMKLLVGGQLHQMVHLHGDIAFLGSKATLGTIV